MKLLCILSLLLLGSVEPAISDVRRFDSIFSFGDSFADTGNVNVVSAANKAPNPYAHPPYGMTFFGRPTGRSSNGRLILDFVAPKLKLPFVRPFLSSDPYYFKNGANFAVSGSTALPVSFFSDIPIASQIVPNTSSSVQLGWFESLKSTLCSPAPDCLARFLDRSVFFVGEFGFNDYSFALLGMTLPQVRFIVPDVVRAIAELTEELIRQGAATLVVPGIPPLGCFPANLVAGAAPAGYDPATGCLKDLNLLAKFHNYLLNEALVNIQKKHPSIVVLYADFYTPIIKMAENPSEYEFIADVLRCCCGGGGRYNFNMSAGCGMPGSTVCDRPVNYMFWDSHFTEAAYRFIAKEWVDELRWRIDNHLMGVNNRYIDIARASA